MLAYHFRGIQSSTIEDRVRSVKFKVLVRMEVLGLLNAAKLKVLRFLNV
jgi:hypothetical protein